MNSLRGEQSLRMKTYSEALWREDACHGHLRAAGEWGAVDAAKSALSGNTDKTLLLKLPKVVSLRGFLTKDAFVLMLARHQCFISAEALAEMAGWNVEQNEQSDKRKQKGVYTYTIRKDGTVLGRNHVFQVALVH